jgi:hypothetical protein
VSTLREPAPGKLLFSVLAAPDWWELAWADFRAELCERFGPVDYETPALAFDHTDYYAEELGEGLARRLLGFERLLALDGLPEVKLWAAAAARGHARPDGRRRVNLDPGLITLERLVLASGKNFTHRVYLGRGVWADLTLIYSKKSGWVDLPWTFPDYATESMKRRLTDLRALYKTRIEAGQTPGPQGE